MAVSQNGWRANDRSLVASYAIPGGKIALRKGDVATVLVYVANRFHSEVEPLKWPGVWGYAERKVRGGSSLSNHASGTAADFNAPAHWLGASGTFSGRQVAAIRRILRDLEGVVRWGGDYSRRKDEMHFEINASSARVRAVARKIRAGEKPGPSGGATPAGGGGTNWKSVSLGDILRKGTKGQIVEDLQGVLGLKKDGMFGDDTERGVKAFQKSAGLKEDGEVKDATWTALKRKYGDDWYRRAAPKPPKPKVPDFELPKGHWYGPESNSPKNHSGYYAKDRAGVRKIQQRLKDRGWTIVADGRYGDDTAKVVRQFQKEKGIRVDGAVGTETWRALWLEPVT